MANYVSPFETSPTSYQINLYSLKQIAEQAYRLAGALKHPGQGISDSESQEALDITNHMIDGWAIEQLLIILFMRTVVLTASNQKDYSVGPGAQWDIERPEKIHSAGFLLNPGTTTESEIPMHIVIEYQDYQREVAKNVGSSIPLVLYYRAALPLGVATLWPVPTIISSIALYTQGRLQEFVTIDDTVITPKGYREMLMYNLAVRVHQRYPDKPMDQTVFDDAVFYKQRVKNQQITPIHAASDPAVMGRGRPWRGGTPKAWTPYD